ncbi:MAG: pantoate--beta-alanine ligase [Armatimonadetes bacterium]|nr:pantoate--beta-alanine ligase [Armatimonadota bacterium]
MKICRTVEEFRRARPELGKLALVPTMGAFHEGHLSLMKKGKEVADSVAISIFVNPLQFAPTDDLANYPRQEEEDFAMAESVGVDAIFAPETASFTQGIKTTVSVGGVSRLWEGEHRPGHFDGVATIVSKLFLVTQPDIAIFGQKDFQQCAVIAQMVEDLNFPIQLQFEPTMREESGLAMSSRNEYFTPDQKAKACHLHDTLMSASTQIKESDQSISDILLSSQRSLTDHNFAPEYFAYVDPVTLEPKEHRISNGRLIVAARFHGVRLIDNIGVFL